jgi:hypothetical protein
MLYAGGFIIVDLDRSSPGHHRGVHKEMGKKMRSLKDTVSYITTSEDVHNFLGKMH